MIILNETYGCKSGKYSYNGLMLQFRTTGWDCSS